MGSLETRLLINNLKKSPNIVIKYKNLTLYLPSYEFKKFRGKALVNRLLIFLIIILSLIGCNSVSKIEKEKNTLSIHPKAITQDNTSNDNKKIVKKNISKTNENIQSEFRGNNIFDSTQVDIGEEIAGLTVNFMDVQTIGDSNNPNWVIIEFGGDFTVSGTFKHYHNEERFLDDYLIKFEVDKNSYGSIPILIGTEHKEIIFAIRNPEEAKQFLGEAGIAGKATIRFSNYHLFSIDKPAENSADFVELIEISESWQRAPSAKLPDGSSVGFQPTEWRDIFVSLVASNTDEQNPDFLNGNVVIVKEEINLPIGISSLYLIQSENSNKKKEFWLVVFKNSESDKNNFFAIRGEVTGNLEEAKKQIIKIGNSWLIPIYPLSK
jgi:hypothetical protein